jgi:hypothetical protein
MSWKVSALSAVLSAGLMPQISQAQEANPEPTQEVEKPEAEAAATTEAPAATTEAPAAKGKGLLGDLRIGPSVAIGFPHPLTGAIDLVYADLFSVSAGAGRFGAKVEETEIEIRNWDATFRFFPFQGSFFVGAAYGNQGIVGKLKTDIETTTSGVTLKVPTSLRLEVESNYLTPQLGWFARWDSGLTLGFDFGYQMPSGASCKQHLKMFLRPASRPSANQKTSKRIRKTLKMQPKRSARPAFLTFHSFASAGFSNLKSRSIHS